MIQKSYTRAGRSCRVTFQFQPEIDARNVHLCGEFNNWDRIANPMKRLKGGGFTLALSLEPGRQYQFKYLVDDQRWENDAVADSYVSNAFGTEDSVVKV
jgi:1,4-alpha-glucan branching enzyme